jgi:D-sedoheptulose 7-phosphate isomerase
MTDATAARRKVLGSIRNAIESLNRTTDLADIIAAAGAMMAESVSAGGKILFCGNGGSAADSQHLAAELVGRFLKERQPLAAVSLTVDTSALTAIANDYGYEQVFARQLRAIGRAGDVLVGISTSGRSPNVVAAIKTARLIGIRTIGLTGAQGGEMPKLCDICIRAPAERTDQIQQLHITIGHILCGLVEDPCAETCN